MIRTVPQILVVEDEAKLARTIALYLGQRGYDVRTVGNGVEALTAVAETRPDVIVTDIMMPVMDGYTLCRRLRADPAACTIPFLFLTAKDEERDRIHGFKMGADDYLTKPCDLAELHARVQVLLERVDEARRIPPDAIRISGQLSEIDVLELIQDLELQQKAGALILKRNSESGVIYLKEGKIVGAELGTTRGREPLASLLGWKSGSYVFVPDVSPEDVRLTPGIANVVVAQTGSKSEDIQELE